MPTCYAFDFEDWDKILTEGGFSKDEIGELRIGLQKITKNAISRTQKDLKTVETFKGRFDGIFLQIYLR